MFWCDQPFLVVGCVFFSRLVVNKSIEYCIVVVITVIIPSPLQCIVNSIEYCIVIIIIIINVITVIIIVHK